MSTEATEARAGVRTLLARNDPEFALALESALNDMLIEQQRKLVAFIERAAGEFRTPGKCRDILLALSCDARDLLSEEELGERFPAEERASEASTTGR